MNANQLKETLTVTMKHRLPVLIKGAPGIGKSDVVTQVAKALKMDLLVMHPVVSDPTDFKGMPFVIDNEASFVPFGDLKVLIDATKPTICFLDDLGQAPACVQAAAMQLILARQINGKKISNKVVFVAATNRRQDRAGVTSILEPVKSRFATILELKADVDTWVEWAFKNRMPEELIGFIRFRPELLHAGEATADIVNHPCPRTIAYAGKLLRAGLKNIEVLAGAIGEGAAAELIGFLRVHDEMPDIDDIMENPTTAVVPKEMATLYAVSSALISRITEKNASAVFSYAERLPADFCVKMMLDGRRKNAAVCECRQFIKLCSKHQGIVL